MIGFLLLLSSLLAGHVEDTESTLSRNEKETLEKQLQIVDKEEGIQIVVAIIPSLAGKNIEQVSEELASKWQVGHRGRGRGVLFLISKKEKDSYISLGYGLEGTIEERRANQITAEIVEPLLKEGKVSEAAHQGVQALFSTLGVSFNGEKMSAPSFLTMSSFLFFVLSMPLLFMVARLAPSKRYWWLSPLIGFGVGVMHSMGLAIVLAALGICMIFISHLLRRVF